MIAVVMRDGAVLLVLYILLLTGHVGQGEGALSGSVETEIV